MNQSTAKTYMTHSLNSFKGLHRGFHWDLLYGLLRELLRGDTRSLDCSLDVGCILVPAARAAGRTLE